MQRTSPALITGGLAIVVAAVLWLWQRDEPSTTSAPSTKARPASLDEPRLSRGLRKGFPVVEPTGDDDATTKVLSPQLERSVPRLEDLPPEVTKERAAAFQGWQVEANKHLMRCLPSWTEAGEVREVRVLFRPEAPDEASERRRLRAKEVEPLESQTVVPEDVRQCLDELLDTEIELPAQAPEVQFGHQETLHVMWG